MMLSSGVRGGKTRAMLEALGKWLVEHPDMQATVISPNVEQTEALIGETFGPEDQARIHVESLYEDGCTCPELVDAGPREASWPRSHYMAQAIATEWPRVVAWHERPDEDTGRPRSWLEAAWVVAENPPNFDRLWDEVFNEGGRPQLVILP